MKNRAADSTAKSNLRAAAAVATVYAIDNGGRGPVMTPNTYRNNLTAR